MKTTQKANHAVRDYSEDKIKIDVQSIPTHIRDDLARFAMSLTKECFSQPDAEELYQEWLKSRKKAASAVSAAAIAEYLEGGTHPARPPVRFEGTTYRKRRV